MIKSGILTPAILALLLTGSPLGAQQADQPQAGVTAADTQEEPTGSERKTAPTDPGQANSTPVPTDDSPFDYESSEEISEDLSVSFPVDI